MSGTFRREVAHRARGRTRHQCRPQSPNITLEYSYFSKLTYSTFMIFFQFLILCLFLRTLSCCILTLIYRHFTRGGAGRKCYIQALWNISGNCLDLSAYLRAEGLGLGLQRDGTVFRLQAFGHKSKNLSLGWRGAMRNQGITKILMIQHLCTMNACTEFCHNLSSSCRDVFRRKPERWVDRQRFSIPGAMALTWLQRGRKSNGVTETTCERARHMKELLHIPACTVHAL